MPADDTLRFRLTLKGFGRSECITKEKHQKALAKWIQEKLTDEIRPKNSDDIEVVPIEEEA